jgi:prophage tail gpP-like protein
MKLFKENTHKWLLIKREKNGKRMNNETQRVSRIFSFSLDEMKHQVKDNLVELERAKLVLSADCYQAIVSRIAQDIRDQRKHRQRRHTELAHLQEVFKVLQTKHGLLKEQVSYYNEYVKVCLDRYNNKKKFVLLYQSCR